MAYAAVASLSHTITLLINYHQHSISPQFRNQIMCVHQHTSFLQSFLEGFSYRVRSWEEIIREAANRAEDIIELLLSDSLLKSTVGSSKSEFGKGKYEICHSIDELEKVTEEIESIAGILKGERRIERADDSDDEVMEIISLLREGSSSLEIISIWGSGGMGKTTLARNAYNHPLIVEHFDILAWSTVSSHDVRRRIALDLLRFVERSNSTSISNSEDGLIGSVCKLLQGRRYLIVLDDAWTPEALDWLKLMLPDNGNGSRIIFTTRSFDLAKSAHLSHEMSLLDEDKSWDLLREKIFKGDPCPFQLESIGKTIARSCRGHPLSIEVISGILGDDESEAAWEDVSKNMKIASKGDDGFLQVLSLSYTYLPHHLRPCFLYLGIFPKDEHIHVSKLTKLWVAEGFVNQSGCKTFEETGEELVEDLVRRNLVSVSKRKSNGSIKSITIHDLMRDLCLGQAGIDNFISIHAGEQWWCRRVGSSISNDSVYGSTVRTIILYSDEGQRYAIRRLVGKVRLLRILDFSNYFNSDLARGISELFHLRYLAVRRWFSKAILNLENLQTLVICGRLKIVKLLAVIWRLPQLRHLVFMSPLYLPCEKGMISTLDNLQTLSGVKNFSCSRENLEMIPNVKKLALFFTNSIVGLAQLKYEGELHPEGYKFYSHIECYELHNLIYLRELEILKIEVKGFLENHIKNYAFPPTLKKLSLSSMQIPWKDMKIVASLPNLQVLKLRNHACSGNTWETSEGGFSQLTFLLIERSELAHWITKSSHFPSLKSLVLRECPHLTEVQNNVGEISTLKLIDVDYCCDWSLLVSLKQIQEDRVNLGNDSFKLVLSEGENKHTMES